MDFLTVILIIVVLILIVNYNNIVNRKFEALELRIMELQKLLKQGDKPIETAAPIKPKVEEPVVIISPQPILQPEQPKQPDAVPEPVIEQQREIISDPFGPIKRPVKTFEPLQKVKEPKPTFFERNPDLEKFIGENLVNKIGIAILVLAIAFFVKYAIDNNWIGPIGRVGVGVICGGILVAFAHTLRKNYNAFSSVLAGGGLAIFYFTITLAYQEFHLFTQLVALSIMVVITIFSVALALLYDKQELAVIALIGGFVSPFLLSNGRANYDGLFIYLLVLNVGLLIIAYYKAWRVLNILAFAFSTIILSAVLYNLPVQAYYLGFRYATIFYLLFFTINIINNIHDNKRFLAVDFSILLINTGLYFGVGLYLLGAMHLSQYRGLFSAALAALNLVLSFILFRNKKADPNVLYLLIGITLTFISLTAPIQLHGHNITMFWASETVLLYWLYQKSSIKLMKLTSLLVWLAMLVSLIIDLSELYIDSNIKITVIANKGFITTIVAAASSCLLYLLMNKGEPTETSGYGISKTAYKVAVLILLFLAGFFEINHQFVYYYPGTNVNTIFLSLYTTAFVCLLNAISVRINGGHSGWLSGLVISALTIFNYLALTSVNFDLLEDILEKHKIADSLFAAHWISDFFVALLFYQVINYCRNHLDSKKNTAAAWIIAPAIVLFLSLEFSLLSNLIFYSKANTIDIIETVYIKTALPVLWGVSSFILMWIGMRNKQRVLRIISLSLFLITLIKLFMFDINNIPVAGKIAAFFCLGVLLLIISFMYQKVKKILVDDEAKQKE
jgi:uncharacterized membrane protein